MVSALAFQSLILSSIPGQSWSFPCNFGLCKSTNSLLHTFLEPWHGLQVHYTPGNTLHSISMKGCKIVISGGVLVQADIRLWQFYEFTSSRRVVLKV